MVRFLKAAALLSCIISIQTAFAKGVPVVGAVEEAARVAQYLETARGRSKVDVALLNPEKKAQLQTFLASSLTTRQDAVKAAFSNNDAAQVRALLREALSVATTDGELSARVSAFAKDVLSVSQTELNTTLALAPKERPTARPTQGQNQVDFFASGGKSGPPLTQEVKTKNLDGILRQLDEISVGKGLGPISPAVREAIARDGLVGDLIVTLCADLPKEPFSVLMATYEAAVAVPTWERDYPVKVAQAIVGELQKRTLRTKPEAKDAANTLGEHCGAYGGTVKAGLAALPL